MELISRKNNKELKTGEMEALNLIKQKGIKFTDIKELTDLKEAHINHCKLSFDWEG